MSVGVNTDKLGDALKRTYLSGDVEEMQNLEVPLLGRIGNSRDFATGGADGVRFAINVNGDESGSFIGENDPLPNAQNEVLKQVTVPPRVWASPVRFSGLSESVAAQDEMAFIRTVQYHINQKIKRDAAYNEAALFRDATGKLGQFAGAPGDLTAGVDVDTPSLASQNIKKNMLLDVFSNSTGNKVASGLKVTDVDIINGQLTFDTNVSLSDNDGLYKAGLHGSSVEEKEINGLDNAIATTGSYLGLSRADNGEWKGNVVDNGATDVDEDILLQAINQVIVVGGMPRSRIQKDGVILLHPNQERKLFEIVQDAKRYPNPNTDMHLGYSAFRVNGMEVFSTHHCPTDVIYVGDLSKLNKFVAPGGEMKLSDIGGSTIKWAPGFDAGFAYLRGYFNYAVRKPNAWAKIVNLNDVTNF